MAINRKRPYGYGMCNGMICVDEAEAGIVREIYAAYGNGASYQQISESLNLRKVPYNGSGNPWNKNAVARILSNDCYTGSDLYPLIIPREEKHRASTMRPQTGKPTAHSQKTKHIRQIAKCSSCGGRLTLSATSRAWERWNCPSCGALTAQVTTPRIMESLVPLLNAVIAAPELVTVPMEPSSQTSLSQAEESFHQLISTPGFDEDAARDAALTLAIERFSAMGSADYETMRIHHILADAEQTEEVDTELLRQITKSILIQPDGDVSLKLKNGQIIT